MIRGSEYYDEHLSKEWIGWVESPGAEESRQKEIYPVIKSWLESAAPQTLLDAGCGQGACEQIVSPDIAYIGVDASSVLIKRAEELHHGKNRSFVEGDVYDLPQTDLSVDAVMSIWVWSHLESLSKAATEMSRVLRPGGKFLVINANPDTYDERKDFYTKYEIKDGVLIGNFDLGEGKMLTNSTLYFHSRDEMTEAIECSGLSVDNVETLGYKEVYAKGLYISLSGHKLS